MSEQVCRECHVTYAEYYLSSPHATAFEEMGLSECIECHNNHRINRSTDTWLGVDENSNCGLCHVPDEDDRGYQVAEAFKTMIDSLRTQYENATELVHRAETRGVEVSEAKFILNDIHDSLLKSRTLIHTFNEDTVRAVVVQGLAAAEATILVGQQAHAEFRSRIWFWILSSVVILALILAIYLKLKEIER